MRPFKLTALTILIVTILIACKKDETLPSDQQMTPIESLLKDYMESQVQSFTVDANNQTTLFGNQGTRIFLSGSNFSDPSGGPISGNVTLNLIEIYSKTQMIVSNKVTTANSWNGNKAPLISGGEFRIEVTQNGAPVTITNPMYISTYTLNETNCEMRLFEGITDVGNDICWNLIDDAVVFITPDSIGSTGGGGATSGYYTFPFNDSYNWVNCDYFYDFNGPSTTISLTAPNFCNHSNTKVYVVSETENIVANLRGPNLAGSVFKSSGNYGLPQGLPVVFVIVTNHDGQLKYAIKQSTLGTDHQETITSLTDVSSLQELETILAGIL
ncbi:MAG: hypothetical protein P8P74_08645 [Crocinitomicaceae bacterium]|nr:hypothetical protein [Crocinitomicaceae bacterium]